MWGDLMFAEFALRSFTLNDVEQGDSNSALAEMRQRRMPGNVARTLTPPRVRPHKCEDNELVITVSH